MKSAHVTITGTNPLLIHADNIDWADRMEAWRNDPKNKKASKAGDDRTPPWRWIGCLNHDGTVLTMPSEYIMRCIMEGAAEVPTGRGKKTFKAQSQSGIVCTEFHWPLFVYKRAEDGNLYDGKTIRLVDIKALIDDEFTFVDQKEAVEKLGFSLFVKRAKIGQSKHIRVRPRFEHWGCEGDITIIDSQISKEILKSILDIAGRYKGLGDWRPGAKTPGAFGMFTATVA